MSAYTSDGKRRSSQTHARRVHLCACGRKLRGNGGWSSHKKACAVRRERLSLPAPPVSRIRGEKA